MTESTISDAALLKRRKRNARNLDEVHLDCRLLSHNWLRVADTHEDPPMFGVRVCFDCTRCGTQRCDVVQRSDGSLLTRSYEYAENYHLEAIEGERPVNAPVMRMELIRRLDQNIDLPGVPPIGKTV